MKHSLFLILASITTWTIAGSAKSQEEEKDDVVVEAPIQGTSSKVQPTHLRFVWNIKDGSKDSDAIDKKTEKKTWATSCSTLGRALMVGQGPWGFGVFSGVSCWVDGQKIAGTPKDGAWTLEYKEGIETVKLTLTNANKEVVSEVTLPESPHAVYFFQDREFADLIAMQILDSLPFIAYIQKGKIGADGTFKGRLPRINPKTQRKFPLVPPPKSMMAYQLSLVQPTKLYVADVVGPISQTSMDKEVEGKQAKKGSSVQWKASPEVIEANKSSFVWIHSSKGRGAMGPELKKAVDEAQKVLAEAASDGLLSSMLHGLKKGLKATTASGYIGFRYGPQVLSGDPLLSKTAFLGVIAEVRGGPLEGVRFYYDKLLAHELDQDGHSTSIAWSRYIIGKSFGLKLSSFVDRIDITPKVGWWTFNANLPTEYDADGKVSNVGAFDMDRAMSFALEFGAEWQSSWYTIRPWYSFDAAGAISKIQSKRVTSNRFGFDTYWTAGPTFKLFGAGFRTAILGFFVYETIGLTNSQDSVGQAESEIVGLTFSSGYAGAGLAISW